MSAFMIFQQIGQLVQPEANNSEVRERESEKRAKTAAWRVYANATLHAAADVFLKAVNGATTVLITPQPVNPLYHFGFMMTATEPLPDGEPLQEYGYRVCKLRNTRPIVENPQTAAQYAERSIRIRKAFESARVPMPGLPVKSGQYVALHAEPVENGVFLCCLTSAGVKALHDATEAAVDPTAAKSKATK